MENVKLNLSKVITQDVGVVFKNNNGDYYTLKHDTFEFVKSKLNYIHPKYFIIIDIGHKLIDDNNEVMEYVNKVYNYIKEYAVWRIRFQGMINTEHVITLKNVKTAVYSLNDTSNTDTVYMHFHGINYHSKEKDLDNIIKNIEAHSLNTESNKCYVTSVNFLGCYLNEVDKLDVTISYKYYKQVFNSLTLFKCNMYSYNNGINFENLYGLLSGQICSSYIRNMHVLANIIMVNNSTLGYEKPKENLPNFCIFHEYYCCRLNHSIVNISEDVEFFCDVKMDNIHLDIIPDIKMGVFDCHKLNFYLPHESDYQYKYYLFESKNQIKSNIFSTYINLYVDDYSRITPHEVTVTIEDLRCRMNDKNKHLFFRAYVPYGAGRSHNVYPLDVLLRDFNNSVKAKFNRNQVKEFYKNIDKIAKLHGIDLAVF